ncbi:MAG: primase [Solirubrobacterales bacterium]|nr:primase [Solirubrobacterales bacterium]
MNRLTSSLSSSGRRAVASSCRRSSSSESRSASKTSVSELAGVELRRQGKDLVGLCPFHEERTGSLVISPEKNCGIAWGACQAGGSVIDWVMRAEGVSFRHAVELLRDGVAPSQLGGRRAVRSTVSKLPSPLAVGADEGELLERVAGFYAQTLRESPEAQGYLQRRGLADSALLERFRLGFANRTLGYRLPAKNRRAGAELRGKLQALGVLRGSGHEHLSGSLVVPVCDPAGRVVQLYGRKVRDDLRAGTPLHLYLPGPRRHLAEDTPENRALIESVVKSENYIRTGGEGDVLYRESLSNGTQAWAKVFNGAITHGGLNKVPFP